MKRPITQEHGTGCAVACVAFALNKSYKQSLKFFLNPHFAWGKGYYCKEIVEALKNAGKNYSYCYLKADKMSYLKVPGTIVYVEKSIKYPLGHYLVKTKQGVWMNPWKNFPSIAPAKSAFQKRLPGTPLYAIYPIK